MTEQPGLFGDPERDGDPVCRWCHGAGWSHAGNRCTCRTTMPSKDTAQARQEDGIARAVDHSGEIWRTYATEFMRDFCRRNREVFCDDIWADGLERPPSPRAFGQIMKDAIRYGWIVKTDRFRPSVQSNNSARQIYESKLYRDETVRRIHSDKQPNQEKKQ